MVIKKIIFIILIAFTLNVNAQIYDLYSFPYRRTVDNVHFVLSVAWGSIHQMDSTNFEIFGEEQDTLIINCYYTDLSWAQPIHSIDTIDMSNKLNTNSYYIEFKIFAGPGIEELIEYCCSGYYSRVYIYNDTKINDLMKNENELIILPNPAKDFITIDYPNMHNNNTNIEVVDIKGNTVLIKNNILLKNYKLNIKAIKKGTYLIKIKTNQKYVTKKLIIE